MNDGIYKIGVVYNSSVKISDWYEGFLQYPLDTPGKLGASHYKSLGPTDEVFIPKTTTQEMLEQYHLVHKTTTAKGLKHPMINFTSFPLIENGKIFSSLKVHNLPTAPSLRATTTTYKRSYDAKHKNKMSKKEICKDAVLHPLFNRLPKSDFEMASIASDNKFMDDHFSNLSEQKKCNNFLRQIRKTSFVPWLGDYQKFNKPNY